MQKLIFNIPIILPLLLFLSTAKLLGQTVDTTTTKLRLEGKVYTAIITPQGDTLILADLDEISITSLRTFASDEDYQKYMRFRR
ncbi:MAG TPA: hypothetical protein PKD85_15755, partial [Saprospiraceae bacterium]|nr:hypothetical protein [Saprospiraceae bacterium]